MQYCYRNETCPFDDRTIGGHIWIWNIFISLRNSCKCEFVGQTFRNVRVLVVARVPGLQVEQLFQEVGLSLGAVRGEIVNSRIVPYKKFIYQHFIYKTVLTNLQNHMLLICVITVWANLVLLIKFQKVSFRRFLIVYFVLQC